jgi:hypothetical protein
MLGVEFALVSFVVAVVVGDPLEPLSRRQGEEVGTERTVIKRRVSTPRGGEEEEATRKKSGPRPGNREFL